MAKDKTALIIGIRITRAKNYEFVKPCKFCNAATGFHFSSHKHIDEKLTKQYACLDCHIEKTGPIKMNPVTDEQLKEIQKEHPNFTREDANRMFGNIRKLTKISRLFR